MRKIILLFTIVLSMSASGQSSMRRCTLLPITDSVGGAIGFKVFEEIESYLKKSNWCTYVSNASMISIFSRYRENLPLHLKQKEVIKTVAEKLKVGSVIRVVLVNEIKGVEVQIDILGEDGEDIYFSEKVLLNGDEIALISDAIKTWLDTYSKIIPYDAKINGILGEQITLDVGRGYPINVGQTFTVKRVITKRKHPLLKKIVDWKTEDLAEGKIFSISENQALGMVRVYKSDKKLAVGDWVNLRPLEQAVIQDNSLDEKKDEEPGVLGMLTMNVFASSSSIDTSTPGGSKRMSGNLYGFDFRVEAWITRQYFAALEVMKSLGTMRKSSGNPEKTSVNVNNGNFKITGGYKYLPIGFFYGPQVDIYGGYASHSFDINYSEADGFGKNSISGIVLGVAANLPINREFRFFSHVEFIPFPKFEDDDNLFGSVSSASALELEVGVKYQYTPRMTIDGSIETLSKKAKFNSDDFKEVSYKDTFLKVGASFNF